MRMLPSIAEIKAARDILSPPDASAKVVKLNNNIAVKYGSRVSLLEGQIMKFVAANTRVPLPQVYDMFSEPETGINFIVMEYVNGMSLQDSWQNLNDRDRLTLASQLQTAINELRRLEPPAYLGTIDHQPFSDGVFWSPERNQLLAGPFKDEHEMNEAILRHLEVTEPTSHLALLRSLIEDTLQNHRTVFTHGDLQAKNIIINRVCNEGKGDDYFDIKLLDWEISGWYPEYWEFCNSTIAGRFRPEWLDMVQQILDPYLKEYLMMQMIRGILFY